MMPVVKGAKSTRLQILLYSLVMVPVACLPGFIGLGGLGFQIISIGGGLGFIALAFLLFRSKAGEIIEGGEKSLYDVKKEQTPARNLFAYSIAYLTLLFATLLVEHLIKGF